MTRVVECELLCMLIRIVIGLCRESGRIWSWHASRMVYYQTELSMQMADVS